jgi:tRNA threonylcarbamoyladenosine biosynthesis protein TsaB
MIVLGVETSGPVGSLALRAGGRCLEERFLPELGRRHAQTLLPEVMAILHRHELIASQIDGITVSIGPGSFTGLRVGVTFAKTFAYAAGTQVIGIETFLAIAENCPGAGPVAVVADAQRGGLILGCYEPEPGGCFIRRKALQLMQPEEVLAQIAPTTLLTGPGVVRLREQLPAEQRLAPPHLHMARAATIARLGEARLVRGEAANVWSLEPLYVRKSGAEEKREARRA